jgi:hypothetical protein
MTLIKKKVIARDTCIFYRSMYEAIKELPKEVQAEIYEAIFSYSLDFTEPELTGISRTVWTLIRPVLEKGNRNYINGSKPKRSETEAKPKRLGSETEATLKPNGSEVEAYKDKDKEKDKEKDITNGAKKAPSFKHWDESHLIESMKPLVEKYGKPTCNAFFSYWTEPMPNGKIRLTSQKAWDTNRRLASWKAKESTSTSFSKPIQPTFSRAANGVHFSGANLDQ